MFLMQVHFLFQQSMTTAPAIFSPFFHSENENYNKHHIYITCKIKKNFISKGSLGDRTEIEDDQAASIQHRTIQTPEKVSQRLYVHRSSIIYPR